NLFLKSQGQNWELLPRLQRSAGAFSLQNFEASADYSRQLSRLPKCLENFFSCEPKFNALFIV
ncbi:hypothetical protein, partial [Pseudophaeobacter sp.]|uniref:hypothetical protein n=1 Tax=Pseudophaeobacter sp. TaxID=1971739 RepID=UPI0032999506